MAQFDGGIFGFLRGKIGTIVARNRYGKTYLAVKPLKYKANQTKEAKLNRNIFSRRQRLNKVLRRNDKIRKFWKDVEADGLNDNTKLMKRNTDFVEYERIVKGAGFTPVSENKLEINNYDFDCRILKIEFKINRSTEKIIEPPYEVFCIGIIDRYFLKVDTYFQRMKEIYGVTRYHLIENEEPDKFNILTFDFGDIFRQKCLLSEKSYFMMAAIKYNELKNKYEYTDTYFEEIFDYIPIDRKIDLNSKPIKYND